MLNKVIEIKNIRTVGSFLILDSEKGTYSVRKEQVWKVKTNRQKDYVLLYLQSRKSPVGFNIPEGLHEKLMELL